MAGKGTGKGKTKAKMVHNSFQSLYPLSHLCNIIKEKVHQFDGQASYANCRAGRDRFPSSLGRCHIWSARYFFNCRHILHLIGGSSIRICSEGRELAIRICQNKFACARGILSSHRNGGSVLRSQLHRRI